MSDPEKRAAVLLERQLCAMDVCAGCGDRLPQFDREAKGPNGAGNWTHMRKDGRQEILCYASSIFARSRWETLRAAGVDRERG